MSTQIPAAGTVTMYSTTWCGYCRRLKLQLDAAGVWSVFLLCAVFALVAYGLVGLLVRFVTPWVSGSAR